MKTTAKMRNECKKCIMQLPEVPFRIILLLVTTYWHLYRLYIIFVFYRDPSPWTICIAQFSNDRVEISFSQQYMEFFPSLLEPWRDRDIVVRVIHAWRDYRENSERNADSTRAQHVRSHKWSRRCMGIMPRSPIVMWNRCRNMQPQTVPRWLSCGRLRYVVRGFS